VPEVKTQRIAMHEGHLRFVSKDLSKDLKELGVDFDCDDPTTALA
jgi:hypothetical protein